MKPVFEFPALFNLSGRPVSADDWSCESNNECTSGSGDDNGCKNGSDYGNGCSNGSDPING